MFKEGVQHPPFFIAISASTYLLTALLFRRAFLFRCKGSSFPSLLQAPFLFRHENDGSLPIFFSLLFPNKMGIP